MSSLSDGPNPLQPRQSHAAQWRSLEEWQAQVAGADPLPEPHDDGELLGTVDRRRFLQLSAASFGLAGLMGCTRQPVEKILPYVDAPEHITPGVAKYYATAVPGPGSAQGVLVETHLGRPTKIEGNPDHPASLGATSVHAQASVLDLYDPDRAKNIRHQANEESWDNFAFAFAQALRQLQPAHGAGFRILTGAVTSPVLAAQIRAVLHALPAAQWHQYEPAGEHSAYQSALAAFGQPMNTLHNFRKADVVLSLDSDFLACGDRSTRYAHDFAERRVQGDRLDMNRLYVAESTMTPTGGKADHRVPVRYAEVEQVARQIAAVLGVEGVSADSATPHQAWCAAVAHDLAAHSGSSIVIAGSHQSAAVHTLAHAINRKLDNAGRTVLYTAPIEVEPVDQIASIRTLVADMERGAVSVLLILGGNPAYDAPVDLKFGDRLHKVAMSIHVTQHHDETSAECTWSPPESHFLETWGDARAFDGTVTLLQPMIEPLYESRSQLEVLDLVLTSPIARSGHDIVRAYWKTQANASDFESWWRQALHDGMVPQTAFPPITPAWKISTLPTASPAVVNGLELVFRADPYLYDGRYANNAWLQELPQPMTKLTWDNAVYLSPATAKRLGLISQNRVALRYRDQSVEGDIWVLPGHPDESATVHLGWGRWSVGRAGNGAGFDVYPLRYSDQMWSGSGVTLRKLDVDFPLATTQLQQTMEGRDIVLHSSVEHYRHEPEFAKKKSKTPSEALSLYPKWKYEGRAWGMSIDLTRCVNCNACVVACQAENNIPVVGKDQVLKRRAMHWLRVDTYYEGDPANPKAYYQPVPCMQCEDAPCELVCPVQATQHSVDGLNDMVYNRCVGTRYCSNNCPYKVRRFNFVLFQDWTTESIKLQRNPDVTVRSRGVMEKCTYCVQRIREAEIRAQVDDRSIHDGEVQTACQQACPTRAIVFGDLNQTGSEVLARKAEKLDYALLAELNTRPRTTYTAELDNPNPEIRKG